MVKGWLTFHIVYSQQTHIILSKLRIYKKQLDASVVRISECDDIQPNRITSPLILRISDQTIVVDEHGGNLINHDSYNAPYRKYS